MLNFNDITLRRGNQFLFSGASFTIHSGQNVGITGANGVGKSSLFALIRNELSTDEGSFSMPPNLAIAHVAQETPPTAQAAIEYVIDGDRELRILQEQLKSAEQKDDGTLQAHLHARLDDIGGYTAHARASRLMSGLGFRQIQQDHEVNAFSGGWRMRLNLAQALMCRSDILLLDEPTNHLDLDAVIWLQDWLEKYTGTLLLISHDRDFLDQIATHILHIENKTVALYTGNYSAFEKARAEKLAQQQSAYLKQQLEVRHLQSFIDRFRAKATKAKQAQSRIKSLEKMTLIAQAHVDSPFHFSFPQPEKNPNPLLQLEGVSTGYDQTAILKDITLSIAPGDRIGLLGPNGAGKSTLIKLLVRKLAPLTGKISDAEHLNIGYFAQHQLEQLQLDQSPLMHLQKIDPKATVKDLRNYLGGFDFHGDKVLEPVAPFSGGEKARLVLALIVYQKPNLLLLDEPTNHIDLDMRHALNVALQDFSGAVVVVSHDRHLLRTVSDELILVANGRVESFDGDLEDYRAWLTDHNSVPDPSGKASNSILSKKEQRRLDAEQRQKLKPLRDAVLTAEQLVEKLHKDQNDLEHQLANPELYSESKKNNLKQLLISKSEIDHALKEAEARWMEASLQLETVRD